MSMFCKLAGHSAGTTHHHNQGLDFAICHHCGCDLIRARNKDWTEVPSGFRIVWREFGRAGDAASVADRMQRVMPPPRRRGPRCARPTPRRDPRGRPLAGAGAMLGLFAGLGKLIDAEDDRDMPAVEASGQYVICLPHLKSR